MSAQLNIEKKVPFKPGNCNVFVTLLTFIVCKLKFLINISPPYLALKFQLLAHGARSFIITSTCEENLLSREYD